MEKEGRVGVHRIWDPAQDSKKKALFFPRFGWASHKACVTCRDLGALNSQGLVVGEKTLLKPRCRAGNEVAFLGALGKTSLQQWEASTDLPCPVTQRKGQPRQEG